MLVLVVMGSGLGNRAIVYGSGAAVVAIVTLAVLGVVHAVNHFVGAELAFWRWLAGAAVLAFVIVLPARAAAIFGDVLTVAILLVRLALAIACLPIVLVAVAFERKPPPPPPEPHWKGVG